MLTLSFAKKPRNWHSSNRVEIGRVSVLMLVCLQLETYDSLGSIPVFQSHTEWSFSVARDIVFSPSIDTSIEDCSESLQQALADAEGGVVSFPTGRYVFDSDVELPLTARIDFGCATIIVRNIDDNINSFLHTASSEPEFMPVVEQTTQGEISKQLLLDTIANDVRVQRDDYIRLWTRSNALSEYPNAEVPDGIGPTASYPPCFRRAIEVHNEGSRQRVVVEQPYHFDFDRRPRRPGDPPLTDLAPVRAYIHRLQGVAEISGGYVDLSNIDDEEVRLIDITSRERVRVTGVNVRGGHLKKPGNAGNSPLVIYIKRSIDVAIERCVIERHQCEGNAIGAYQCERVEVSHNRIDGNSFGISTSSTDHTLITNNSLQGQFLRKLTEGEEIEDTTDELKRAMGAYSVRGIKVYGSLATTISNNVVESYSSSLKIEDTGRTVIANNHIVSSNVDWVKHGNVGINLSQQGFPGSLYLRYDNIAITGNVISGASIGIYVAGNGISLRFRNESGDLIREYKTFPYAGKFDITITGNVIKNSVRHAIKCSGERVTITGNQITNFNSIGVGLYGKDIFCFGNQIFSEIPDGKFAFSKPREGIVVRDNETNMTLHSPS